VGDDDGEEGLGRVVVREFEATNGVDCVRNGVIVKRGITG